LLVVVMVAERLLNPALLEQQGLAAVEAVVNTKVVARQAVLVSSSFVTQLTALHPLLQQATLR
jgi:hypothetical protein